MAHRLVNFATEYLRAGLNGAVTAVTAALLPEYKQPFTDGMQ
jgi:hypothetical protein